MEFHYIEKQDCKDQKKIYLNEKWAYAIGKGVYTFDRESVLNKCLAKACWAGVNCCKVEEEIFT